MLVQLCLDCIFSTAHFASCKPYHSSLSLHGGGEREFRATVSDFVQQTFVASLSSDTSSCQHGAWCSELALWRDMQGTT